MTRRRCVNLLRVLAGTRFACIQSARSAWAMFGFCLRGAPGNPPRLVLQLRRRAPCVPCVYMHTHVSHLVHPYPQTDGERLPLAVKDLGSSDIYPQSLQHSPNGRFVTVGASQAVASREQGCVQAGCKQACQAATGAMGSGQGLHARHPLRAAEEQPTK